MILFHLMINNKQRKIFLTMQKLFGFANFYDENFTFTLGVKPEIFGQKSIKNSPMVNVKYTYLLFEQLLFHLIKKKI